MKELIETIVKSLVDKPEEVNVKITEGATTDIVDICVAKEDLGKVIGKKGKTAQAIRTIAYSVSFKTGKRYTIDITSEQ